MYKLLADYYPFGLDNDNYEIPLTFVIYPSETLADLLANLLKFNPEERLGGGGRGASQIKEHPFFCGVDWTKVAAREMEAPDISWIAIQME